MGSVSLLGLWRTAEPLQDNQVVMALHCSVGLESAKCTARDGFTLCFSYTLSKPTYGNTRFIRIPRSIGFTQGPLSFSNHTLQPKKIIHTMITLGLNWRFWKSENFTHSPVSLWSLARSIDVVCGLWFE